MENLRTFVTWLSTLDDDYKFYDGELCQTCLVGKFAQRTRGRPYLAFDGSRIVSVDGRGMVDDRVCERVDMDLKKFVSKFDAYIGVWGKGILDGYQGPFENVTAGHVKDFLERG